MTAFTYATMFTGGDLFGVGAQAAGLAPTWGVELEEEIAEVGRKNSAADILSAAVEEVDFSKLAAPYLLHASPVCTRASVMQAAAAEDELDMTAARATAQAVETLRPPVFTLENVFQYRNFEAFRVITSTLFALRYKVRMWHLNAADYGTPQTRKRLILVAARDFTPRRPPATHAEQVADGGQLRFFDSLQPWRGWYGVTSDLHAGLKPTGFPAWQLGKLPAYVSDPAHPAAAGVDSRGFLVCGYGNEFKPDGRGRVTCVDASSPSFTILASTYKQRPRAVVGGQPLRTSPRFWARLQGLPDSYTIPDNVVLASRVIGNGVPPPLAEAVVRSALLQFRP